ncbi:hypothetical protein CCACVL1_11269 [Corchorus capsularis]|uniref:Zinc finger, CCCH-type n=1 Tax=Corchorus capsularis TaxID=210143 RepID=A0A1R3IM95_COCAP|nr:hypothetical protein CCACVL1_11269 [Corchorus capsularis]
MEFSDYTKVLYNRIKKLEPENASKIIGYLLLQERGDQDIVQLALCPDMVIQEVIYKAKADLQQLALKSGSPPISPSMNSAPAPGSEFPSQFTPFSPPVSSRPFLSPRNMQVTSPYWEQQLAASAKHNSDFMPSGYMDELQSQSQFLGLEEQMESLNLGNGGFSSDYCYSDPALGVRTGRRHQNLAEFPVKTCHYFNKGFCKHGSNCRYFHGQVSDNFPQMFSHNSMDSAVNEETLYSLEKLEVELVELLKTRREVSIASLPLLYYEKYGKVLQADGYLTESQRHGKAGYSLTKLLARLKNSIRVIDKPHGQHSVILAEDAPKYIDYRNDRNNDLGSGGSGSRQIYLTFPAESTFSEDDVSNYFSSFGQVEDVRIPCQQKRMFGFVTFVSADTVKMILHKGNPHYVCGARVLVKPYREKSKLVDRKYQERIESPMYYSPQYVDMESELHPIPRGYATTRLFRKQYIEEPEQIFELERRRPSEMHLAHKPLANQSFFGYSIDGLKVSAFSPTAASDEKTKHVETNNTDQESEGINLPDSPFASK